MAVVKIIEIGKEVREIYVDNGTTVSHALNLAGVVVGGRDVRVNDPTPISTERVLLNGDTVFVSAQIKGNNGIATVKIVAMGAGAAVKTVAVAAGSTIKQALEAVEGGNYYVDGRLSYEVRLNSSTTPVSDTTVLASGDSTVFLTKMVKGNFWDIVIAILS